MLLSIQCRIGPRLMRIVTMQKKKNTSVNNMAWVRRAKE